MSGDGQQSQTSYAHLQEGQSLGQGSPEPKDVSRGQSNFAPDSNDLSLSGVGWAMPQLSPDSVMELDRGTADGSQRVPRDRSSSEGGGGSPGERGAYEGVVLDQDPIPLMAVDWFKVKVQVVRQFPWTPMPLMVVDWFKVRVQVMRPCPGPKASDGSGLVRGDHNSMVMEGPIQYAGVVDNRINTDLSPQPGSNTMPANQSAGSLG